MAVRDWHVGKLVVVWVAYLFLLWFLLVFFGRREREVALFFWALLAVPGVVITWKWFGGREA